MFSACMPTVCSVSLFVCLCVLNFLALIWGENDKMKSSIVFHGGTKNLNSPTAKYRINGITQ